MKTDYMLKGQQHSLDEPRASMATERDRATVSVKKAIATAESSDNLIADLKEALVPSLEKALAKRGQPNPDASFDAGAPGVIARPIISKSQRISSPIRQEGQIFFPPHKPRGCPHDN